MNNAFKFVTLCPHNYSENNVTVVVTWRDTSVTWRDQNYTPWLQRERELYRERERDRYRERERELDRDHNIFLTISFTIKIFQRITYYDILNFIK